MSTLNSRLRFAGALAAVAFVGAGMPARAASITDVVFVMASDGGITTTGWDQEVNFVQDAVANVLPLNQSKVGLVEFSTTTKTALSETLLTSATQPTIETDISNLSFLNGYTYMSDGIQAGIDVLQNGGAPGENKLMVLISNGIPNPGQSQNPCDSSGLYPEPAAIRHDLAADSISVLEVMVGPNVSTQTLGCLVNYDPDRVVPAASASTTLSSLLAQQNSEPSVPEPGTVGLAMLGAAGVVVWERKKRLAA